MTLQTSSVSILYPELCPNCENFDAATQKCRVAAVYADTKSLSEVMISDITGLCPYFEAAEVRPTVNEVEPFEAENAAEAESAAPPVEATEESKNIEEAIPKASAAGAISTDAAVSAVPLPGDGPAFDEAAQVVAEAEGSVPPELQASIPIEEAARIVSIPPEAEVQQESPPEAGPEESSQVMEAPQVYEARPLEEARIHCPKCKVENAGDAVRCQNCGELLLPAAGSQGKPVYFVFGVLFAAAFAYLYYQFYVLNPGTAVEQGVFSPLILGAFVSLLLGIVLSLRRPPEYLKYEERASRHIPLNALQSLADVNKAMSMSPEREHNRLLKLRADVYDKLGLADDATRDRLAVITSRRTTRADAGLVYFVTGADADMYAMGRRKDQVRAVLSSGKAIAIGYCPRCRSVVELDANERCKVHPRAVGQNVEYVIAPDKVRGKLSALGKVEKNHREAAAQLTGMLALGEASAVGYCPKSRSVVALDVERKCVEHPRVKGRWVQYAVPADVESGKQAVLDEMKKRVIVLRDWRNVLMVLIVLIVVMLVYVLTR